MTCELSVLPGERIVYSRFSGEITIEDRMRNRKDTLQFCREKSINKVLVDMRGQVSLADTMAIFNFGQTMQELALGFRIAIVCDLGDVDAKFIDDVAANRGTMIKSFHSYDQAHGWLVGCP